MAWRDSRRGRRRLFLFVASMILGVAALVAISSFGKNLQDAVEGQAKTLLGADLKFERDEPFSEDNEAVFDSLGGTRAHGVSFASMVYFPKSESTRLGRVQAVEGDFPFYGELQTRPVEAAAMYQSGPFALVDGSLLLQFDAQVGDEVKIGQQIYTIAGELLQVPGESAAGAILGPRVYVPLAHLDESLLGTGSRVEFETYFKFEPGTVDPEEVREALQPYLREHKIGIDTVQEEREEWGEAVQDMHAFLNLVGFIALLLGGLGVASSVHVYVRQKIDTVATLRCIGALTRQAFAIYLLQAAAMGLVGALIGAVLGVGIQMMLPQVFSDFIPVDVNISIAWVAVFQGLVVGLGVALVFALLPLLRIRKISPLRALRASVEDPGGRDTLRWVLAVLIAVAIVGFAVQQTGEWDVGLGFAAAVGVAFGFLYGTARLITALIRRYFPGSWPYVWRQGLANLYRPNNQTAILMLALGFGTFLIMTLYLTQQTLLGKISIMDTTGQPNVVLFDVQSDQEPGVRAVIDSLGLTRTSSVPIVTMRLSEINGRGVEALREDTTYTGSRWPLRREYRSTYRSELTDSETLLAGTFIGQMNDTLAAIPISIERDIADDMQAGIGDELVFNVQGVHMKTRIASIREVDWQRVSANFFVVFPAGVLEDAPQFFVITARTETTEERARLQSTLVQRYPNVSIIDIDLVLRTANALLNRISFIIQFMALFSILTGLTVLVGSVIISRFQRIQESVLLRTMGATRSQILRIMVIEYLFLGCLATLTGLILAVSGTWALAFFLFDTAFTPPPVPLLIAFAVVSALTIGIGLANSRGIIKRPPLEVLRAEA